MPSAPVCPLHPDSRVTRAGWYGQAPHRRQRWWCRPKKGPRHRFTELLPRRETESCECSKCRTTLDPWEGPQAPRTYTYAAQEIAWALTAVASGQSYRHAAERVRTKAGRPAAGASRPWTAARPVGSEGQLVANWVDVFTDVVVEPDRRVAWPRAVTLDSASFRIGSGPHEGRAFRVLCAVGHPGPGDDSEVIALRPVPRATRQAWVSLLTSLDDAPELVVTDNDNTLGGAVRFAWPNARHHLCEYHLRANATKAMPDTLIAQTSHPIHEKLPLAFSNEEGWEEFEAAVQQAKDEGFNVMGLRAWMTRNRERILAQAAERGRHDPHSVGACEIALRTLKSRLGTRYSRMTNRRRAEKLFDLITADLNGLADEDLWMERLRIELIEREGRPSLGQRKFDDEYGVPSLLGPPVATRLRGDTKLDKGRGETPMQVPEHPDSWRSPKAPDYQLRSAPPHDGGYDDEDIPF